MSPKGRVIALAGFVAILAFVVIFAIVHHKDKPSQRPAAVASVRPESKPGPSAPTSTGAPSQPAGAAPPPDTGTVIAKNKKTTAEQVNSERGAGDDSEAGDAAEAAPSDASGSVPPALDPANRSFVVDTEITALANGRECALTQGDVLSRLTNVPDADNRVNASVAASKKSDCPIGQTVSVGVDDLQEMYNHFQEQLSNGARLPGEQGQGGIPKATHAGSAPIPNKGPLPLDLIIANAQAALANGQLITPTDNSALYWARRARRLDPSNETATRIENTILLGGIHLVQLDRKAGSYQRALDRLTTLQRLYPNRLDLAQLRSAILVDESRGRR